MKAASRWGASSSAIAAPASGDRATPPVGGSVLPTWRSKRVRPARNRATVTCVPSDVVSVRMSTANPAAVELTEVHPGSSVVVVVAGESVVVGATVVVGLGSVVVEGFGPALRSVVEQAAPSSATTLSATRGTGFALHGDARRTRSGRTSTPAGTGRIERRVLGIRPVCPPNL